MANNYMIFKFLKTRDLFQIKNHENISLIPSKKIFHTSKISKKNAS